jgi:type I restriction-modification system DNA methylase subunit
MTSFDKAHRLICDLAEDFRAHKHRYLSPDYQEAEARKDFIDKFWKALGWDVDHEIQKNPYEQEVKVERGQDQAGARKRADYSFSLAPNFRDVRFFVEAKKPSVQLENADDYFQTVRYGWNSQNPLAVLTDFEQLHILDCRYKPSIDTALSRGVPSGKFHYSEYADAEKFARIYWLFAREAVAAGSIEKFAADMPKPSGRAIQRGLFPGGYQSIDEAFLDELDETRADLARGFKKTNPGLSGEDLTEIVQRTIDRLVFIRFLEDRLIENQHLVASFGDKGTAWEDFIAASRRLDGVYNGIVFKRHAKLDDRDFAPDDTLFSAICEDLSHINSPYDFNAIPIHILGSIYERFLGKVIVATDKRVRVEEKPEVRKAGGVYYTPEYIVRYIVENTVGKLIESKSPAQIAEMKFADVACGSGSFLLGVYDLLIRYHTKFYNENPGKTKAGDVVEREDGLHLTLQKKREILLNNIFGVDIDMQAVEVAQLSLYLKLLQDETPGSARAHQLEFHETLLPVLNKNITCGNSLIGTDILSGELFEPVEERKLNPMDFEQRFPQIIKRGGFDAIVGNPPWITLRGKEFMGVSDIEVNYLIQNYPHSAEYKVNSFALFMDRAIQLLHTAGRLGYIIPTTLLSNQYLSKIRKKILEDTDFEILAELGKNVFAQAVADVCITILSKGRSQSKKISVITGVEDLATGRFISKTIPQKEYLANKDFIFETRIDAEERKVTDKIESRSVSLRKYFKNYVGIVTGDNDRFISNTKETDKHQKIIIGRDLSRYFVRKPKRFVLFDPKKLHSNTDETVYLQKEKILIRKTGNVLFAALDAQQNFTEQTIYNLVPVSATKMGLNFFLAIINSKLLQFYFSKKLITNPDAFPYIKGIHIDVLPIKEIDFSKPADKARHDKVVSLVEQILLAKKQLAAAQSDKDKDFYENKCAATDRQIDALVYELYGLTEDEIKIVEQAV